VKSITKLPKSEYIFAFRIPAEQANYRNRQA